MKSHSDNYDPVDENGPHFQLDAAEKQEHPAWEEVDAGRFMPRRVRGSCQGRALG